jgi:hypothetical protein
VKAAPLALCLVWAAPARADVAVPQKKTWRDGCAARIDAAAEKAGMKPGARVSLISLRREDGTPNPVQYVEYATPDLRVEVGDEPESRPDQAWHVAMEQTNVYVHGHFYSFRRYHNRFAKIEGGGQRFRAALDECLQMGESK